MQLYPMWMKGLPPDMVKTAEDEIGETPDSRKKGLQMLKEMVEEEQGFEPLTSDGFLLRFLRAKKYNVKRAHKTLKNYYSYKASYSGLFTDLLPSDLKLVIEMNKVFICPKRCSNGTGIIIALPGSLDVDVATPDQLLAAVIVCAEIGIENEGSQVCGNTAIIDFKGLGWNKTRIYSNPVLLSRIVTGLQDCWPYRMNALHITNEPPFFSFIYNIIRPMLSKKLRERVHFHGENMESLHQHVPPETLPKELGGPLGEKDFAEFKSLIYQNEHIMERINRYVYEGEKYPTRKKTRSNMTDMNHELIIVPRTPQNN